MRTLNGSSGLPTVLIVSLIASTFISINKSSCSAFVAVTWRTPPSRAVASRCRLVPGRPSTALLLTSYKSPSRPARTSKNRPRDRQPGGGPEEDALQGAAARRRRVLDDDDSPPSSKMRRPQSNIPEARTGKDTETVATNDLVDRNHFFSRKSLDDPSFPSDDVFLDLCRAANIVKPSKIQSLAWPVLATGTSSIVADQTGSGKTLAYLLPCLHRVLSVAPQTTATTKAQDGNETTTEGNKKRYGTPRMVVLTPTSELADQVKAVLDTIRRNLDANHNRRNHNDQTPQPYYKFSSAVVTATGQYNTDIREQIRRLQRQKVDVLVSTPGRLATILRTRNHNLDLSLAQTLVLDEVDVLLQDDDSFGPQLRTVAAALGDVDKTQFVFCTATLPDSVVSTIEREFPVGLRQIRGPGLHRVAMNLKENLVDVSVPSTANRDSDACFDLKAGCLLDALRKNKCRRTLVFCNTVDSCRDVENLLKRHDRSSKLYSVLPFHNALAPEVRNRNLQSFVHGPPPQSDATTLGPTDSILVCTDRAARGVDFASAPVDHVVIFDFPKDPAEYVRRVGRTARAGRPGTCTVFAYGWQLPIARSVMGSKLSGSVASSMIVVNDDDDDSDGKFRVGSKQGRRRPGGKSDESIKGNIEKGTLWGD